MKLYFKPILSVAVLAILLGYTGCGGSNPPGPSAEEVQLGKLVSTWKVGSTGDVLLDNVSKKSDYAGFTLTLSGTAGATSFDYTTAGRPALSAWKSGGKWKFGTDPETDIIRDPGTNDEIPVTYTVTENQLEITFNYNGDGEPNAKTNQVTGQWVFRLSKN